MQLSYNITHIFLPTKSTRVALQREERKALQCKVLIYSFPSCIFGLHSNLRSENDHSIILEF